MEEADASVNDGGLDDDVRLHPEKLAFYDVIEFLRSQGALGEHQNRRRKRHGIDNPDDRFMRDFFSLHARCGEDECAEDRESQGIEVQRCEVFADFVSQKNTYNGAERGNLGECEIDKNNFACYDVYAEIYMDAG